MPHYFDEDPNAPSAPRAIDVVLPGIGFSLLTDAGVFSHGHLDTGTALLLREAPRPPSTGTFVDLGCGSGAIAVTLALSAPDAIVWAVDVNARARHLTSTNAERAGLGNVRVAAPDELPGDVRFDLIWSNPPIRVGKQALHELLDTWLPRLAAHGRAVLVVQRNLGADSLHRWLEQQGWATERLTSRAGYRLLEVRAAGGPA